MSRPLRIGVTGGIGSGKTAVCDAFAALGVPVIDADEEARAVVAPGSPLVAAIAEAFGADVLTPEGGIDRARLRRRVFADPQARRRLEALVHPEVYRRMEQRIRAVDAPYVVVCVPLLVETGRRDWVDRLLVVDAPPELQRERVMRRDRLTAEEAEAIMRAQLPREERLAAADDVLVNVGSLDSLRDQVAELHRRYLAMAAASPS